MSDGKGRMVTERQIVLVNLPLCEHLFHSAAA